MKSWLAASGCFAVLFIVRISRLLNAYYRLLEGTKHKVNRDANCRNGRFVALGPGFGVIKFYI